MTPQEIIKLAAQLNGKKRWKGKTKKEKSDHGRYMAEKKREKKFSTAPIDIITSS